MKNVGTGGIPYEEFLKINPKELFYKIISMSNELESYARAGDLSHYRCLGMFDNNC